MTKLICFYRISDNSQKTTDADGNIQIKQKPDYITKRNCIDNFVRAFKDHTIIVIADNCCNDTLGYITKILYEKEINFTLIPTNFGNGAASFRKCVTTALNMEDEKKIKLDDNLYFVEDDYVHKINSDKLIVDGLKIFDYVTLYDHPDKYVNGNEVNKNGVVGNPFINNNSEQTRVYLGEYCHWKLTNSTTMTFGIKLRTLKEDLPNILKYVSGDFPYDFNMFMELITTKRRLLGSSIPGFSTHGETKYLSPLDDWGKYIGFI